MCNQISKYIILKKKIFTLKYMCTTECYIQHIIKLITQLVPLHKHLELSSHKFIIGFFQQKLQNVRAQNMQFSAIFKNFN